MDQVKSDCEKATMSELDDMPPGWDETRVENLLLFATSTPEQKVEWLWEMLKVIYGWSEEE